VKKPAPLASPWKTLRPNTTTTCGKHNIGAVIGYLRRRPSCGEYRMGSSLALTCGAFCCLRYAAIFAVLRGKAIALSYPAEHLDKIIPLLLRLLLPSHLLCAQRSCSRRRSSTSSKQTALSSGKFGDMNSTRRTEGTTRQKSTSSSATSLSKLARRHGLLGVFGEEGCEAVHSATTLAALLCESMKTPQARLQAIKRHLEAKKRAKRISHVKKSRVIKKKRQSLAAAAPQGADGGP